MRWQAALVALSWLVSASCSRSAAPVAEVTASASAPVAAPSSAPAPATPEEMACARGTGRVLGSLREPMDVTAWVTSGTPKLAAFARALEALLRRYEQLGQGKLVTHVVEVVSDEQRQAAKDAGLQEANFGEAEGPNKALIVRGFLGLSFKYRTEKESIPILSPEQTQGLEFWITNKIREVRDRADDVRVRIGVLTGKDEIKLSEPNLIAAAPGRAGAPTMKGIMEQALPFYKFEDVDLQGGEAAIDDALQALVVTQPGRDYTEKELSRIDAFLTRGNKAAVFFTGAVNMKASDASMHATLSTRGLSKLLDGYGVELRRDAILDWGRPANLKVQMKTGAPTMFGHPPIPLVQHDPAARPEEQPLESTFPAFFRIDEMAVPFPSTLVPHPERQPTARVQVMARTSPKTTVTTDATAALRPLQGDLKPSGDWGPRAVAIAVEGELKSALGGTAKGKARLLVVSSSQFLTNPYARAGNPPPARPGATPSAGGDEDLLLLSQLYAQQHLTVTILVFKNTLDWMTSAEDLVACSALLLREERVTDAGP